MKCLIDTNICIYIMNKGPQAVMDKIKEYAPGDIGISSITLSELEYGVAKSQKKAENAERLRAFLMPFTILPFDEGAATVYGTVRYSLEKAGTPIGPMDLLIGSHALALATPLVTNNVKEFSRIQNLKVINWL